MQARRPARGAAWTRGAEAAGGARKPRAPGKGPMSGSRLDSVSGSGGWPGEARRPGEPRSRGRRCCSDVRGDTDGGARDARALQARERRRRRRGGGRWGVSAERRPVGRLGKAAAGGDAAAAARLET